MRFNQRNWIKYFDGSNKKTTIRLHKSKVGHHKAYAGSYFKPVVLGEFDIIKVCELIFKDLTLQNAIDDGFSTIEELKNELERLNGPIKPGTILYQHWTTNTIQSNSNLSKSTFPDNSSL